MSEYKRASVAQIATMIRQELAGAFPGHPKFSVSLRCRRGILATCREVNIRWRDGCSVAEVLSITEKYQGDERYGANGSPLIIDGDDVIDPKNTFIILYKRSYSKRLLTREITRISREHNKPTPPIVENNIDWLTRAVYGEDKPWKDKNAYKIIIQELTETSYYHRLEKPSITMPDPGSVVLGGLGKMPDSGSVVLGGK